MKVSECMTRDVSTISPDRTIRDAAKLMASKDVGCIPVGEDDKLVVQRARKIQQFLSQPFAVAEQFTNIPGKFVPLKETVRSFKEIIEGKHDDLPEQAFRMQGSIDDVVAVAAAQKASAEKAAAEAAPVGAAV